MLSLPSYAAVPPPPVLPGNANPARAIDNNQLTPEPESGPSFPVTPVAPTPENTPPAGAEKVMLVLHQVTLEGVTAYNTAALEPIYAPYIGKQIRLSKLYEFTNAITERYHQDGYALSRAILPPQKIGKAGNIRIRIIEGYIDKVELRGKIRKSYITDAIADRIASYRPLNIHKLERDILLLNDLAGMSAQAVLKPKDNSDSAEGAVGLALIFSDVPFQSSISADNYNSRYVGPYEAGLQTGLNNVILPYWQTTLNGINSIPFNFLNYAQIAEHIPLNSWGTTATLAYAYAHTQPGYRLEPEDIKSDSYNYSLALSQPVMRTREENLNLGSGLTLKDIHTDYLQTELYADRLTIANISAEYDLTDRFGGANLAQVKLNQGLDDFDPSPNNTLSNAEGTCINSPPLSRCQGRSNFTDVTFNVGRLQGITDKFRLYVAAEGQYSWSPLLSSEQFGFGGQQFGRAYDTSELTGDNGLAGSAELRYSVPSFLPSLNSELFTFYDIGRVWDYHAYESSAMSAASAGVGLRLNQGDHFSGTLTIAQPLTKRVDAPEYGDGKNARVFGAISYKF